MSDAYIPVHCVTCGTWTKPGEWHYCFLKANVQCESCGGWHDGWHDATLCPGENPPVPVLLFDIPAPTFWAYRVEWRVWVRRQDGQEGWWAGWQLFFRHGVKRYYLTERAAAKALARVRSIKMDDRFYARREFRVARFERRDRTPARRR